MTQKNCARAYGEHSGKRSEAYLGDNEKVSTVSQEEVYGRSLHTVHTTREVFLGSFRSHISNK